MNLREKSHSFFLLVLLAALPLFGQSVVKDMFDLRLDPFTDAIAIPDRGLLLERGGTILTHTSMQIMTAVVQLEKPRAPPGYEDYKGCQSMFHVVMNNFERDLARYQSMTEAVFEAKNIFTTEDVCRVMKSNRGACSTHKKKKRFIGVGAYILAGAALAMGSAGLSLATANRVELDRINNYIEQNVEAIDAIAKSLVLVEKKQKIIIDSQQSVMGFIKNMTISMEKLMKTIDCFEVTFELERWTQSVERAIRELLQFVLAGKTFGNLTPSLIEPDLLVQFLEQSSKIHSDVVLDHPNILYQTAMANLIKVDFTNLQFTYVISFPFFDNNSVFPFFSISQLGFEAYSPMVNNSVCLRISMPRNAVIHDGDIFLLNTPLTCPMYANVMICSNSQLELYPLESCLRLENKKTSDPKVSLDSDINCPLVKCWPEPLESSFISTSEGILVKTRHSYVTVQSDRSDDILDMYSTGSRRDVPVPDIGSVFIAWKKNISSVSFAQHVIYSPRNAKHHAKISISTRQEPMPRLTMSTVFDIPSLGANRIDKLMKEQRSRLQSLESEFRPALKGVRNWAEDQFSLPIWVKVIIFTGITLVLGLITLKVLKIWKERCVTAPRGRNESDYATLQRHPSIVTINPTPQLRPVTQRLYPTIRTLNSLQIPSWLRNRINVQAPQDMELQVALPTNVLALQRTGPTSSVDISAQISRPLYMNNEESLRIVQGYDKD